MLKKGDIIPEFNVLTSKGESFSNKNITGKTVVFYFYPKDDTPGCTKEGQAFSENLSEFKKKGIEVYGISKCSVKKHQKFCEKYSFEHELLSDEDNTLCEDFGVWKEKSMYGRKYMGIERSTFVIDPKGKILKVWDKVKIPGHI
ncbi:MAG: thioredoxin-dependent thiol peroxidase, partial [Candidatus Margulisiibacteriota bacterium]